ncbi:MAG: hypothetical protein GX638_18480, partial [Crenarchaeota archaeon]|nr:hypothetical protein [Thermoproteota archaeon]
PTAISLLGAKCYWFKSNQAHACSSTGGAFVSTMESRFSFIKARTAILFAYKAIGRRFESCRASPVAQLVRAM